MNFLRDTLNSTRVVFHRQVFSLLIWIVGISLLWSVSWRVAIGFYLMSWYIAANRQQ